MIEKTKNFFKKNRDAIGRTYKNYTVTISIILLCTIVIFFLINKNNIEDIILKIFTSGMLMSLGSFAIETFSERFSSKRKKIILFILEAINIILSIVMGKSIDDDGTFGLIEKFAICYGVFTFLISIYYIIKQNKIEMSGYILKVLSLICKSLIIYGILALGILAIMLILNTLLINTYNIGIYILKFEILLTGFYLIPQLINAFTNMNVEIGKFAKNLIKYVLMPIIIATFIVIYIYMIKIIISRNIPKNQVFMILSVLFVIGMMIWTSMQYLKDESVIYKISIKLPYFYIPFIFLQAYSMTLRVIQGGITPARYLGYMLIIFEIIYIMLFIFNKRQIHNIIIAGIIITIISILIPKINMFDVSNFSQISAIKSYSKSTNKTTEQLARAKGAYYYLMNSKDGVEYIKKNFSDSEIEELNEKNTIKNSTKKGYTLDSNAILDIKGYSKLTQIDTSKHYGALDKNTKEDVFSNMDFEDQSGNVKLSKINILNEIQNWMDDYNAYKDKNQALEIVINENQKIILMYINIEMNEDTVEFCYMSGFLLEN